MNHTFHSFEVSKLTESRYISPYRLHFHHNNQKRVWDCIMSHPSVSCILYHTERKSVVLVRQFRPVVYVNKLIEQKQNDGNNPTIDPSNPIGNLEWSKIDPNEGFTYELCAGICDKSKSLEETIKEEIFEECGFTVDIENIHRVKSFRAGVGLLGCLHTIFYAEIDESMRTGTGGGNKDEGEFVELFELKEELIKDFLDDETKPKPPGLLYGLMWFQYEKDSFLKSKKSTGQ